MNARQPHNEPTSMQVVLGGHGHTASLNRTHDETMTHAGLQDGPPSPDVENRRWIRFLTSAWISNFNVRGLFPKSVVPCTIWADHLPRAAPHPILLPDR